MYKKIISNLKPEHVDFAFLFAESNCSFDSMITSCRETLKVRASSYLQSTAIWEQIILAYRKNQNSTFKRNVIFLHDECKEKTSITPLEIFDKYCNPESDFFGDPFTNLKELLESFKFFAFLDRKYFLYKIITQIENEFDVVKSLAKIRQQDFAELNSYLRKNNIFINKILSHER